MNHSVVHFEMYVDDLERAKTFYEKVLNWAFSHIEEYDYWLVYPGGTVTNGPTQEGINGGMLLRSGPKPGDDMAAPNAFVCTVNTDDIDATLALVVAQGGRIDMPADHVMGVGRLAYIRDTEGNLVGLLQPDPRGMGSNNNMEVN